MPVSVAQGDPVEFLLPNNTKVGGSVGGTFQINNSIWQSVASVHLQITATATVGTRFFIFQFQDSAGNIIVEANCGGGTITAGNTIRYMLAPMIPFTLNNVVLETPIPFPTLLPPNSKFAVFDVNNTDANDALSQTGVMVLTQ